MIVLKFYFTVTFLCTFHFTFISSYDNYLDRIPNSNNVPNPCNPSAKWYGIGHIATAGAGARNPFGTDFAKTGRTWSTTLCQMDSDGDGKTNGAELGDPNCVWTEGSTPPSTTGISHPGVCE
ncbi:uncharacterized protein TRIADDRAFT_32734, partial [Trichoplax adhaerens]